MYIYIQVNEKFHKLERGYRDCIKRKRDKTMIYSIPNRQGFIQDFLIGGGNIFANVGGLGASWENIFI